MQGREDVASGVSVEVDVSAIAQRVIAGEKLGAVTLEVADAAMRPQANSTMKRKWLKDNAEEITEAGIDKEKAFTSFLEGQIDELRYILEEESCDAIDEILDSEEEPEEEPDEEDDEPDEDGDPEDPDEKDE
jgi:hypothetical protein